LEGSGSVF